MAMISRAGLVVLALVACAWFGLGAHQARDTHLASALISAPSPLSPPQERRARLLLGSAGRLNPDLNVAVLSGQLAFDQHDDAAAERIFESVTKREPLNLAAWTGLAFAAARAGDRHTLLRAGRHVAALYPKLK